METRATYTKQNNVVYDYDLGTDGVHLTREENDAARTLAMVRTANWVNEHPTCTIDAFKQAKKDIFNQSLIDAGNGVRSGMFIGAARARYNAAIKAVYELAEYNVITSYKAGNSIRGISSEMDIPESTVRNMVNNYRARETH